jgi:uncharacterized membrane protein
MNKKEGRFFLALCISLLPLLYLAIRWEQIPLLVPMHYNFHFQVDRMGKKISLFYVCLILAGLAMLVYLLLTNLNRIDPKRKDQAHSPALIRLAFVIIVFFAALNGLLVFSSWHSIRGIEKLFFPSLFLFLALLGHYMQDLEPNYFAGIRLPWTLASDDNWRKTHQLTGKVWFVLGLASALLTLIIPVPFDRYYSVLIGLVMLALPIGYSYHLYSSDKKNSEPG